MSNEKDKAHEHDYVTACFDCGHIAGRAEVEALRREAREEAAQIAFAEAVRLGISAVRAIAIKHKTEAAANNKKGEKDER